MSDDEGEHDLDLHKFDNHRIELPIPEGAELVIAPPPAAINIKTPGLNIPKIETETGVQFTHDGKTSVKVFFGSNNTTSPQVQQCLSME